MTQSADELLASGAVVWLGNNAPAARIAENRSAALADRQVQIDVATFIQWIDARAQHRTRLAAFYRARFRPGFRARPSRRGDIA